jgi:hypothetical protein
MMLLPREAWAWFGGALIFIGALHGVALRAYSSRPQSGIEAFKKAMERGQKALADKRYSDAETAAKDALKERPNDIAAVDLLHRAGVGLAEESRKHKYEAAIAECRSALLRREWDRAIQSAEEALSLYPDDTEATNLLHTAREQSNIVVLEADRKKRYVFEIDSARSALAKFDYDRSITHANEALLLYPGDQDATRIRDDAKEQKSKESGEVVRKKRYGLAIASAQAALKKEEFNAAINSAEEALSYYKDDTTASKIRDTARELLKNLLGFNEAIGLARDALGERNFPSARLHATQAIKYRPNDTEASRILDASKLLRGDALVILFATSVIDLDSKDLKKSMEGLAKNHGAFLIGSEVQLLYPSKAGPLAMVGWPQRHNLDSGERFLTSEYKEMVTRTFDFVGNYVQPRTLSEKKLPIILIWLTDTNPPQADKDHNPVPKVYSGRTRVVYHLKANDSGSQVIENWFGRPGNARHLANLEFLEAFVDRHVKELRKTP